MADPVASNAMSRRARDFTLITWIAGDGDETDELVPWHTQAEPGHVSWRAGRDWVVAAVERVCLRIGKHQVRSQFVTVREVVS